MKSTRWKKNRARRCRDARRKNLLIVGSHEWTYFRVALASWEAA